MCLNSRNSQMAQKGLTFDEINPFINNSLTQFMYVYGMSRLGDGSRS